MSLYIVFVKDFVAFAYSSSIMNILAVVHPLRRFTK